MSTKLGKYYICDRCGTTSFFEKIGEAEGWNIVYSEASRNMESSRLLCPTCSEKYNKLMKEFFDDWRDFDRRDVKRTY